MIAMLVECTDYDYIYGILNVEAVDEETVQQKIYEIKNKFYEEGFDAAKAAGALACHSGTTGGIRCRGGERGVLSGPVVPL